jgi:hypothetical protein
LSPVVVREAVEAMLDLRAAVEEQVVIEPAQGLQ